MCRHLGYLGPPTPLEPLLFGAPHALVHQARCPREQAWGDENPDGWGVGWWASPDAAVARYRATTPMWLDRDFHATARATCAHAAIAAARYASPGSPVEIEGTAPFDGDGWLCSLNGIVDDFYDGAGDALRAGLSSRRRAALRGNADTEVLFAGYLDRLDLGDPPDVALAAVVHEAASLAGGRYNFLVGDGAVLVATAWGSSLYVRESDGVAIASEPLDHHDGWEPVADRTLVVVDRDRATVRTEPL